MDLHTSVIVCLPSVVPHAILQSNHCQSLERSKSITPGLLFSEDNQFSWISPLALVLPQVKKSEHKWVLTTGIIITITLEITVLCMVWTRLYFRLTRALTHKDIKPPAETPSFTASLRHQRSVNYSIKTLEVWTKFKFHHRTLIHLHDLRIYYTSLSGFP